METTTTTGRTRTDATATRLDGRPSVPVLWRTLRRHARALESLGDGIARYGLVLVVAWIGAMKFTGYEAEGIRPLVASSPLLGWAYRFVSVQAFSSLLGVVELGIAGLIALGPRWPRAAALGAALAVGLFATTLSFLFSAPGWEPSLGGFPAVSAMPGQFLLKDAVLLGASVGALGRAGRALQGCSRGHATSRGSPWQPR